jgi:hypothetical protein
MDVNVSGCVSPRVAIMFKTDSNAYTPCNSTPDPHHSPQPFHPAPLNPTSQTTFGQLTICPSENSLRPSKQHECSMNQLMRSGLSIIVVTWNNKKEDL